MRWLDTLRTALRPSPKTSAPAHVPAAHPLRARPGDGGTYLPSEHHAELLRPGPGGLPPLRLVRHNGALWLQEESTGRLVNLDNRYLAGMGIWGAKLRGVGRYDGTAVIGAAELTREPDNPHDPNAVAVYANDRKVGYYNKAMARRVAKLLDAGESLTARFISADPAKVIAARQDILDHLYRSL